MARELINEELIKLLKNDDANKSIIIDQIVSKNAKACHRIVDDIIKENPQLMDTEDEYRNEDDTRNEMFQEAVFALLETIEQFDFSRGTKFITIAWNNIYFRLYDYLNDNHLIRIPKNKRKEFTDYYKIVDEYEATHDGNKPSDAYIIKKLGVPESVYRDILRKVQLLGCDSINREIEVEEDETIEIRDYIADKKDQFQELIDGLDLAEKLGCLTKKELKVLWTIAYEEKEQKLIASELGVSTARVSAIYKKAVEKMNRD